MPRVTRGLSDGMIYHVINRGNCRQDVFHNDADYHAFVELLAEAKQRQPLGILAYCLMPNHFHLLLAPEQGVDLSRYMQWLMTSHVRRHHRNYRTSGHVWQGRYKSFIVNRDAHLFTMARYIEANPARGSLVGRADEWRWSSLLERMRDGEEKLLDMLPPGGPGKWLDFVNTPLSEHELARIRQCVNRGAPFGSPPWRTAMCRQLGLESTVRAQGRPKKWGQEK